MNTPRTIASALFAALAIAALTTTAHADEVYSNFGPGNSHNALGYGVGTNFQQALAVSFISSQNFTLTSFDIFAGHSDGTNSYLFSLVADNGGLPTGTNVFSPISSAITGTNGDGGALNSFSASGSLLAGQKYWLVMGPGALDTFGVWYRSATVGEFAFKATDFGPQWNVAPASTLPPVFRINGRPTNAVALTPEVPAGVQAIPVLLAVGSMALYQRKKKAARS